MRTKLLALMIALAVAATGVATTSVASAAAPAEASAAAKKLTKKQKAAKRRAAKRRAAKRRAAKRRRQQQRPPATQQPPAATPEAEATSLLTGKRLHVYVGIDIHDSAAIDKVFHFCPGGRFVYEYKATTSTDYDMRTLNGSWGVEQAAFGPNREWAGARVRTAGEGESYLLEIVSTARGVRVDGNVAEVTNSSLC
jgi:Ni/Co efflux regulator RcnB